MWRYTYQSPWINNDTWTNSNVRETLRGLYWRNEDCPNKSDTTTSWTESSKGRNIMRSNSIIEHGICQRRISFTSCSQCALYHKNSKACARVTNRGGFLKHCKSVCQCGGGAKRKNHPSKWVFCFFLLEMQWGGVQFFLNLLWPRYDLCCKQSNFFVPTMHGVWLSMREIISSTPKEIEYRRSEVIHSMSVMKMSNRT